MSISLHAESGENVNSTIERAIDLARKVGCAVTMNHNDRDVLVGADSHPKRVYELWNKQDKETQSQSAWRFVWVAYFSDWSGAAVFADELEAHRYALPLHMNVRKWMFGQTIHEMEAQQ